MYVSILIYLMIETFHKKKNCISKYELSGIFRKNLVDLLLKAKKQGNCPLHTGANPFVIQIGHMWQFYLTTNCLYVILITKSQKNPEIPENIESGWKIRIRIPENFWPQIFLKFDFKGGLWSKVLLKNDFNPQKSRFFAFFMYSTFLHKTEGLM